MAGQLAGRRERQRRNTLAEIHAAARRLLVTQGPAAVTINAVAREVGMTGPALYHYYAGLDDLHAALTAGFYEELAAALAAARDAHAGAPPGRRLLVAARAMRQWAITHRAEFGWLFARPAPPAGERRPDSAEHRAAVGFEQVFLEIFTELWETDGFRVPEPVELAPGLRDQLTAYSAGIGGRLPPEAAHVFLTSWIRLYGLLSMEVLHQLSFALSDLAPVFEECLRELTDRLGLPYEPPA
ncbi:TetR/AcrR family transcriptional regulator [Nonomuraea sp. NPDC048826]|uniref:TetR/AcrR family transcriptional regulator n=1 Tax=Nonomuraea sp. NPDC048826 TaxID=3364347 RepID=UPI003717D5CF